MQKQCVSADLLSSPQRPPYDPQWAPWSPPITSFQLLWIVDRKIRNRGAIKIFPLNLKNGNRLPLLFHSAFKGFTKLLQFSSALQTKSPSAGIRRLSATLWSGCLGSANSGNCISHPPNPTSSHLDVFIQGEIWPRPKVQKPQSEVFALRKEQFRFEVDICCRLY